MDAILTFFTETLTGPWYIVYVVVLVILIFACIGYLSERAIYLKKKNARYAKAEDPVEPSLVNQTVDTVSSPLKPGNIVSSVESTSNENPESSLPEEMVMPVVEKEEQVSVEPTVQNVIPTPVPLMEQTEPPVTTIPVEDPVLQAAEPPTEISIPVIPTIETGTDFSHQNDEASQVSTFPSKEETVEIPEVIETPSITSSADLPK